MRLSVVVPCFNEENNIAPVVTQAADVGRRVATQLEIIVVDDGSTDGTSGVLADLRLAVPELRTISHQRNQGYGAAIRSGFSAAQLDYVFLTDGDGQFDLRELEGAVTLLRSHDVVAGYRAQRQDGWWRQLCGKCWTGVVNQILGLHVRDANCAFKLLPRRLLSNVRLRSNGALISAELLFEARQRDLRIRECAVTHYPRSTGRQSGASLRVVAVALRELVAFTMMRWDRLARLNESPNR